jgi:hypothetical protein
MYVFRLTRISCSSAQIYAIQKSLSNLFNTLPRESALRPLVYKALLELASSNDELHVLQLSRTDVEKWLKEWDVTPAEKSTFLKALVDVFSKAEQQYVTPLYFPPLDTLIPHPLLPYEQRHGLPLQTCTHSLTGPRVSIGTVCRVRHDRYCGVDPDSIRP